MATVPPVPAVPAGPLWRLGEHPWLADAPPTPASARLILDNDFAGDPDDLFQLVHHVLSPSVEVPLVVSSRLRHDHGGRSERSAADGARVVEDVFARMGLTSTDVVVAGSEQTLTELRTPQRSAATERIVAEAMRDDPRPLFYVAGGGLTDLASAYLAHPEIAGRFVVVWIGGFEHEPVPWLDAPRSVDEEYNLSIDVHAAQVVFDAPGLDLWQIPRSTYTTCVLSDAESRTRVRAAGPLGRHLDEELRAEMRRHTNPSRPPSEAYVLGDSCLVVLTALRTYWTRDASSCRFVTLPKPGLTDDGRYVERPDAPAMRVWTHVDVRLVLEDLFAKLRLFESWRAGA